MNSKAAAMRLTHILLLALGLLLAGCPQQPATTTPTPAATPSVQPKSGDILPGEGVGELRLGQTKEEVEKLLGEPQERDANEFAPGTTYGLYYRKGLELTYQDEKLAAIVLHREEKQWSAYPGATSDGLWVGSDPAEVTKVLGPPPEDNSRALRYPKQGLWFRLDDAGKVESLSILGPEA